ncbi:MAG: cation diffusion facilitator family transporter [Clostridia bacterium]|nr:cation diffusion facilitator family transporter [Clostridia bacterium]
MLNRLVRRFVKNPDDVSSAQTRSEYGVLAGAMGMALNIALFAVKLPIGAITGSAAIISDAFNNLTDMASSLVTVAGMRIAARKPDKDHPFGYGRMEYVATFIIAMLIMLVGFEMLEESVRAFMNPTRAELSVVFGAIMLVSCGVKIWMFTYNRGLGKLINSDVLRAASMDSAFDAITTFIVIVAAALESHTDFPTDAIASLAVSLLIMKNGIGLCVKTVNQLLGGEVNTELREKIFDTVIESPIVLGAHDLIVHDYGPGRVMASIHAEIDAKNELLFVHERINEIETRILDELNVSCVIHMDPVVTDSEAEDALFRAISRAVYNTDRRMRFHDMQVYNRDDVQRVEFDLLVPTELTPEQVEQNVEEIKQRLDKGYPGYIWDIRARANVYARL